MTIAIKVVTTKIELNAFRTTSFKFFEKKLHPFTLAADTRKSNTHLYLVAFLVAAIMSLL